MSPSRTLVVAPSWVGDLVMAQPLIAHLAGQEASGSVDVLAPAYTAGLCARMPGVGAVLEAPFGHGDLRLRVRWQLGRRLARQGYTRAVVLPNTLKSALVPWFAGIPRRTGYVGESRYGLINDLHRLDKQAVPRMVDRYWHLGQESGSAPEPRLRSDPGAGRAAAQRLDLALTAEAPWVLCPGAEYGPAKRWPAEHFAAVAQAAHAAGRPVWILGSPKDQAYAEDIRAAGATHATNLCGRTTLADAVDLMALAGAVITNDSGLMHVAAALDVRTVALFGSSSPAFTPPLSAHATALSLALPCSPCFQRTCPLGHLDCLTTLRPERVLAVL